MILKIRETKAVKGLTFLLVFQLLIDSMGLNAVFAGDGGPSQPEVQSFEPISTNQMVDPFTGDFTYNIPLFNLPGPNGGYPVNLAYHSGIQMDQEASWVGLGWNINMGTINRQVRNLPDDFQGETVKIKTDQKPNWTVSAGLKGTLELIGFNPIDAMYVVPTISAGARFYYNNYRGFGYSGDFGLSLKVRKIYTDGNVSTGKSNISGDLGFNIKKDSREGISGSVTVGFSNDKGNLKSASVSTGFTQSGWQKDLNISAGFKLTKKIAQNDGSTKIRSAMYGAGSSLSFAKPVVLITSPQAMRGGAGSFVLKTGINLFGVFPKSDFNIGFELSKLKNKNKEVNYKGVGYLYYQNNTTTSEEEDFRVKDVSVENEGLIHKDSRRLAIPTLTYDNYSVTGQGIGSSFRPYRAEIGNADDPNVHSEMHSGNLGIDLAPPAALNIRFGIDAGYSFSGTTLKPWPQSPISQHTSYADGSMLKSVYFQKYGEHAHDDLTANYGAVIASNQPVAYALNADDGFYKIENLNQQGNTVVSNFSRTTRKKRAEDIESYTNSMILDGTQTVIPEFKVKYYNTASVTGYNSANAIDYDGIRSALSGPQIGAFVARNESGMRYVYALPAQNKKERDVVFSASESTANVNSAQLIPVPSDYKVAGTSKYYNSVEKGSYAHSHLLTSILGADYVDLDNAKGPSDGDLGYWVKFSYFKAHDNFKWKSPYKGVNYSRGYKTSFKDGTVNYSYGEKEVWYVATVETKTHVAEFIVSNRPDCRQSAGESSSDPDSDPNKAYKQLDKINVYLKSERYPNGVFNGAAKPIQTCHFQYFTSSNSLCKGTPDNPSGGGKLTLEKVWFTYRNNQSGATNPYVFDYYKTVGGQEVQYSKFAVDRWGNYKPYSNIEDPYNDPYLDKAANDERVSLWNLKSIALPSGGKYEIKYESDTYAYVQNEVAMQMFKVANMGPYRDSYGQINTGDNKISCDKNDPPENRRVYFKLEKPIPMSYNSTQKQEEIRKYIKPGEYLFFKVDINLTKASDSKELVAGYSKVGNIGVDETSYDGSNYLWGFVELEPLKVDGKDTQYHPFTEVGARHIRYNQPDILVDNLAGADMDNLNKGTAKTIATSLISAVASFGSDFKNYTESLYGNGNKRLSEIDLNTSYLRMRTPDKIKYGGGHRVREILVYDNWENSFTTPGTESGSVYGTVYEYDITDANGVKTSSGVATYEPLIGGDENPMRNPVKGWEEKNILAKNVATTYSEEPGNESVFPGASVGYSSVRILSKNTADKKANFNGSNIVHYGGISVQEFYTAKDFPVITKVTELETDKTFRKSRLIIPAVFVNIDRLRMAATQGYYIETNDMHGKPKGAKELALVGPNDEQLISTVEYDYFDEEKLTTNRAGETFITRSLKNNVNVLLSDINTDDMTKAKILPDATIATDIEFIPRTQYIEKKNTSVNLEINVETFIPLALLYPIPAMNYQAERIGTVVTNKIVSKSGIVKKIIASQKGSTMETESLVFDDLTGNPLLMSVTNDYGDKVYSYSVLAKDVYDRSGASYRNIGMEAFVNPSGSVTNGVQTFTLENTADLSKFVKGDQILLVPVTAAGANDGGRPKAVAYCLDLTATTLRLELNQTLSQRYKLVVIQSGRKNNLLTPVSRITALSNPTINRTVISCSDKRSGDLGNYKVRTINNVINIDASELGEFWYKDTRQINSIPTTWYNNALYSKGFGGNFQPVRNYIYVDNRTQSSEVDLRHDGIMNNVALFDFDQILATPGLAECGTKWRLSDQINLLNPSSISIETKDILNVHAAALYGRNGFEPIAIAENAKNAEIGFENFEEYTTQFIDIDNNSTNNLNFYATNVNSSTPVLMENRYEISGDGVSGRSNAPAAFTTDHTSIVIRLHIDALNTIVSGNPVSYPKQEVLVRVSAANFTSITSGGGQTNFQFSGIDPLLNIPGGIAQRNWRGEMFLGKNIPNPGLSGTLNSVELFTGKGHTGNKSLLVATVDGAKFLQRRLNLSEGKEYQFSGWFSTADIQSLQTLHNSSTYFESPFKVEFLNASNVVMSANTITCDEAEILQGTFVDDWQKFTINFVMPAGAKYVRFTLPRTNEVFDPNLPNGGDYTQYALFDDLRVQPRDASMETYVYNNDNQRLEAELDENNYATFFYYDDEGQLFLVKQETEKGIITVKESRSSFKKN